MTRIDPDCLDGYHQPSQNKNPNAFQVPPQLPRLTHTSGLSYGVGFGEEPSDATETGYAKLVKAVDQGTVRHGIGSWPGSALRIFGWWGL